jgi:predicted ribosome quality control (RQC) complex YloA/Tae2 family protein
MPLDGISAKCLALELNHQLQDARIDRIYQPERTDILLIVRARQENLRLLLSANPAAPRIHLTREVRENPAEPPMFCMLLRKYLSGARIMSVETPDYERIFIIRLATQNELGDTLEKKLVVEIMGRHSNIILLNQDLKIHDAIVHVDPSISRLREIMPARTYQLPQNQHKAAPDVVLAQLRAGQFSLQPAQAAATLDKALLEMIQGFSPQLCQSVVIRAGLNIRQNPCQLSETAQQALLSSLGATLEQIVAGQFQPTTYYRRPQDTSPYDYHALRLVSLANPRSETSLSDAMDRYYLEQTRQNRLAQQRQALLRQIEALLGKHRPQACDPSG